ncbi:MAG TPA: hypothetical protein VKD22_10405 [Ramlibacter sp.]|nr:hypothetical protein [Ramlibacter sp.]
MISENSASQPVIRLLAALHRYQRRWELLIKDGLSRHRYRLLHKELMTLQRYISSFPLLAGDFRQLVMRHAQLLRSLSKPGDDARRNAEVSALSEKHRMSAEVLRKGVLACIA